MSRGAGWAWGWAVPLNENRVARKMPSRLSERTRLHPAAASTFGITEEDEIEQHFKNMVEIPVQTNMRGVGVTGETQVAEGFRLQPFGCGVNILSATGISRGVCGCCLKKCDAECRIFLQSSDDARLRPPVFHPVLSTSTATGSERTDWRWDETLPIGGRYCPRHLWETSSARDLQKVGPLGTDTTGGHLAIKIEVWRRATCPCKPNSFIGQVILVSESGVTGLPWKPTTYQIKAKDGGATRGRNRPMLCVSMCSLAAVPIRLNVYSLGKNESLERLNEIAKGRAAIVHVGLEVAGVEWSYGFTLAHQLNSTGVFTNPAARCRLHTYKWSHELGTSSIAPGQIAAILSTLGSNPRWLGNRYALLENNCCHFCYELAGELGVRGRFPRYVDRLARAGHRIAQASDSVQRVQEQLVDGRYSPFQVHLIDAACPFPSRPFGHDISFPGCFADRPAIEPVVLRGD